MRSSSLGALALLAACWGGDDERPGEPVGVFEASGLMVEQSCGAAIPAPDPLELDFELRTEEGGRAYWQSPGGPIFAGVRNADEYTFTVSQSWTVIEPDRFRSYVGCSVTQRDTLAVAVEALEDPDEGGEDRTAEEADLAVFEVSGSQMTEIAPVAGSDCTPAVAALGGEFQSLPCRVEYVVTGTGVSTADTDDIEEE